MSHFTTCKTALNNRAALLQALADLGFANVEVSEAARPLIGYQGDARPEKAELIIRRQFISALSNDIGFRLAADGTYQALICEYDASRYDANWLARLAQRHAYHVMRAELAAQGFDLVEETSEGGDIRLLLKRSVVTSVPFGIQEQEVEGQISGDGQVTIAVRGMKGTSCLDATSGLESALGGCVVSREMTLEAMFQAMTLDPEREKVGVRK